MASLTLHRRFAAPPHRVFDLISRSDHVIRWWGHDSMTLVDHNLCFDRPGPWHSELRGTSGARYKMSGQVTHVDPPASVGFTWAWHDDDDARGDESHVTIQLEEDGAGGTAFTLTHVNLSTEDAATRHEEGWAATLKRLEDYALAERETRHA